MTHEIDVELGYAVGQIDVRFNAEDWPDNWNELESSARTAVEEALYEIADIHEWRDSFETAQEYSMPGMSPEPEVGSVIVDGDEFEVNLTIETIHDCDWE